MTDDSRPSRHDQPSRSGRRPRWVCPTGMLVVAGLLALAFALCHVLGLRSDVGVIFQTTQSASLSRLTGAMLYVGSYVCFITVVPVMVLAAGLFALATRALSRFMRAKRGSIRG